MFQMAQAPMPVGECLPGGPELRATTNWKRTPKPPSFDGGMFWQALLEATP